MRKGRVPMTISVPPELAEDYEKLARLEDKNKSELFREMFKAYRMNALRERFYEFHRYGVERAKAVGVYTEEDVDRIVFEGRHKKRSK